MRVVIADSHPVVRYGLTHLLDAESDIQVIGEACTFPELADKLQAVAPDVTVFDLELVKAGDLEPLRALRATAPTTRLIVYTTPKDFRHIARAVEMGAQVYLLKDSVNQELIRVIRIVHEGGTHLEAVVASALLKQMRRSSQAGRRMGDALSPRQHQVLVLLAAAKSNRSIAEQLSISERTVKFHVSTILTQLRARNRLEAVLNAAKCGLVHVGHLPERRRGNRTDA